MVFLVVFFFILDILDGKFRMNFMIWVILLYFVWLLLYYYNNVYYELQVIEYLFVFIVFIICFCKYSISFWMKQWLNLNELNK